MADCGQDVGDTSWEQFAARLAAAEREATSIRQFQPQIVPGLLQTEAYARTVVSRINIPPFTTAELDRIWWCRSRRQELWQRPDRPDCVFVIDEAALTRDLGNAGSTGSVMADQVRHLHEFAARFRGPGPGAVEIRIVPAGQVYPGLLQPFVLIAGQSGQSEPGGTLLYRESVLGDSFTTSDGPDACPDLVAAHEAAFEDLVRISQPL